MENTNGNVIQETDRRALGRGLEAILSPNPTEPPESEAVRTAAAIPAIIKILADLPEPQVKNVFDSVQAIKRTANRTGNEIAEIGENLNRLERERMERKNPPQKKGWFKR